jgi:hypothetical protein
MIDLMNSIFEALVESMEKRCIRKLVRRMHSDLDNARLQQRGTKVLRDLHERNFDVIGEILSFVQERPGDSSVARFGSGLIKNKFMYHYELIHHNDRIDRETQRNLKTPIDRMVRNENDPAVQEIAMKEYTCMRNLNGSADIDEARATRVLLQAMRNHPYHSGVQVAACNALCYLHEAIIAEEWPPLTILNAMTRPGQCAYVQMRTCALLRNLLEKQPEEVSMTLPGREYVQPFLLAMKSQYAEGPRTQMQICKALNNLFFENTDNSVGSQIANEGGIERIVGVIIKDAGLPERPRLHKWNDGLPERLRLHKLKDDDILAHLAMFSSVNGTLPLHYAAAWNNAANEKSPRNGQLEVLEHLLSIYPEAATVQDGSGLLPLHAAIEANAPLSVLEALLRVYPAAGEAVCRRHGDEMWNFPPFLMAAASGCDLEPIYMLLRPDPALIIKMAGA